MAKGMVEITGKTIDAYRDAVLKQERAELVALCKSLKSEHWAPAKHDGLDGLDHIDYYDAACEDIVTAILARKP